MHTLELGSEWESVDALKHACATYAVENRFPTKIVKRNANQFDMRCKNEGCTWRVYASKYDALKFVIKTFVDEHYNCPGWLLVRVGSVSRLCPTRTRYSTGIKGFMTESDTKYLGSGS